MKVTMQVWLEVFMMFLMISYTCQEPLTQGVAFNDNALLGDGFDQNIIEITELPETGGPQVSVNKTSDQIQDNHHQVGFHSWICGGVSGHVYDDYLVSDLMFYLLKPEVLLFQAALLSQ